MPSEAATVIAYFGAFVGLIGGGVALFNARKAVQWKRAELANGYLKELGSNQELVFACRAMDWNGGLLVVPDNLLPLVDGGAKTISHEAAALKLAMKTGLTLNELKADFRMQIYRTAIDTLLTWLNLIASALDRNLFEARDIDEVGFWVHRIEQMGVFEAFIDVFGYREPTDQLRSAFRYKYVTDRSRIDTRVGQTRAPADTVSPAQYQETKDNP